MGKIIDLTFVIESDMPTCGTAWHQKVKIEKMGTLEKVGRNTSRIIMGSHSGTHMDAPLHFIENGVAIDKLDLEKVCGEIQLIDFSNIKKQIIKAEDFAHIQLKKRILLRFGWDKMWGTKHYYENFPYLELSAAEYLVKNGVQLVAMDTPSPDTGAAIGEKDDSPVHKLFLKKGIIMVEYLTNTNLLEAGKRYEIIALPLKIIGCDGSPARVIAREID